MTTELTNKWAARLDELGAKQVIYELRQDGMTDAEISDFFYSINFYPDADSWES